MTVALSPRLAALVDALPLRQGMRVLEIGCGPGAAARAVAGRIGTGQIVAIDRSAKAVQQARAGSADEIASGRMIVLQASAEDFRLAADMRPFDLIFAFRVGAFDGRHPAAGRTARENLGHMLAPGGRVFIDGGDPLRELRLAD